MAGCDPNCCTALVGDVFIGPAMLQSGEGYEEASGFGWGRNWGESWGGFGLPTAIAGGAGLPAARPIGNAQLAWTPRYRELSKPARFGMSGRGCSASKVLDGADVSLTMLCHSFENMRTAFLARQQTLTPQTVAGEYLRVQGTLPCGLLIPFAQAPINSTVSHSLYLWNPSSNVIVQTLTQGVDYAISFFGVRLLRPMTIAAGLLLRADYGAMGGQVLDAHVQDSVRCSLIIEARNVSKTGASIGTQSYKGRYGFFFPSVTLYPHGARELFSDTEFARLELTGELDQVELSGTDVMYRSFILDTEI